MNPPIYELPCRFVDIETTHVDLELGEIIEIAIVDEVGRVCINEKVFPTHIETASQEALEINGYDAKVWDKGAVFWAEIEQAVINELRGCLIIGQRPEFDLGFILKQASSHLYSVDDFPHYNRIDISTLIWEHLCPPCSRHSIRQACALLGISNKGAHTALVDAERARLVCFKLSRAGVFERLWWRFAAIWRL